MTGLVTLAAMPVPPDAIAAAKVQLRIEPGDMGADAELGQLLGVAAACAERFLGSLLLAREVAELMPARAEWQRLAMNPVRAILSVEGVPAEGAAFALPVGGHAIDLGADGGGWVRVMAPGIAGRVRVTYRAGLSEEWAGVPEPVRHGVLRLVGHLHAHRDGTDLDPPAAVAALWRPWRRMRL